MLTDSWPVNGTNETLMVEWTEAMKPMESENMLTLFETYLSRLLSIASDSYLVSGLPLTTIRA